jgi:RNA polymerase-binding transcription factor DksA
MNAEEVQEFRRRLEQLVAHVRATVSRLEAELQHRSHGPDETATDARSADRVRTLLGIEGQVLGEANEALTRVESGTFGRCEGCARPIPRNRLGAMPYARHCAPCARTHGSDPDFSLEPADPSPACSG